MKEKEGRRGEEKLGGEKEGEGKRRVEERR